MFSSMSSMETTWVECIEPCRNFKVDVHSIVGVIKAIVFMFSGSIVERRFILSLRKALTERPVLQVVIGESGHKV